MHRFTSLDFLRWIAVIGMILFHANYLWEHVFHQAVPAYMDGFWQIIWYSVVLVFITVSGIVSTLSRKKLSTRATLKKAIQRISILSLAALNVSVTTLLFFPEQKITWGILHFFALASLIGMVTVRFWVMNLILGSILLMGSRLLPDSSNSILLIPFGMPPRDYFSADYYPLFPWFGYYLIGQGIGNLLYQYHRLQWLDGRGTGLWFFLFCGRHALIIYLLHVPILYVIGQLYLSLEVSTLR